MDAGLVPILCLVAGVTIGFTLRRAVLRAECWCLRRKARRIKAWRHGL